MQYRQLSINRGSWLISEFFLMLAYSTPMTPSRQEIDHPKSSSSSSTSTSMTSSTEVDHSDHPPAIVSSESVDRQVRRDPYSSETPEELLCKQTKIPKPKKKRRPRSRTGRPVSFRHTGVAARVQRKPCGWQSSWTLKLTRQFLSWINFRAHACEKCGFG